MCNFFSQITRLVGTHDLGSSLWMGVGGAPLVRSGGSTPQNVFTEHSHELPPLGSDVWVIF